MSEQQIKILILCIILAVCLFLSGFLMFAFSALGPATGNSEYIFYISMYGELLMVIFLILHDMFGDRKKKKAESK